MAARISLLTCVWLMSSAMPALAQPSLDFAVSVRRPGPTAFYVLARRALPGLRSDRLPPHAARSWGRYQEAERRLAQAHRARMRALRLFDDRWRARLGQVPEAEREPLEREMRSARSRVMAEHEGVERLDQAMSVELDRALTRFRRASSEHGLGQLALAELEVARASSDFIDELDRMEASDPEPEGPDFARAIAAATRASRRLRGRWRAWALYLWGVLAYESGDGAAAEAAFGRVLELPPSGAHGDSALRLAEAHFEEARWDAAIAAYEQVLELDHDAAAVQIARYKLPWACLSSGRWPEARDHALRFLETPGEQAEEVRELVLPLALASASDLAGQGLPHTLTRAQRSAVMLSLARVSWERFGDGPGARVALEAAAGLAPPTGAVRRALDARRQMMERAPTARVVIDRLARAAAWACLRDAQNPASFVAVGRVDGERAGFVDVLGAGEATACLETQTPQAPASGADFSVTVTY